MATEKRLIDANRLKANFVVIGNGEDLWFTSTIRIAIDQQPTVDAVEVVRCKDCKHYVLHALACRHENFNGVMNMNGFCSYGERRTDG